jgi:cytoskeletal protein RodZ
MSQPATERPAGGPAAAPAAGGSNVFQRKFGPLPGWGWAALAAVAAGGYLWWRNRQGAAAAATDTGTASDTAAVGDDVQGQLSTIQTEIQDLQGTASSNGSTTPANSGSGTGSSTSFRHVSTGKETLNQIAKARNTSVAHLVAVSTAGPESKDNLAKLVEWAKHPGTRRKGVVYYTGQGPAEGA